MTRNEKEEIYKRICECEQRELIEESLFQLFDERDIRKIAHRNLDVFVKHILPRLSAAFRGGRHGG